MSKMNDKIKGNLFQDYSGGTLTSSFCDYTVPSKFKRKISNEVFPTVRISENYVYTLTQSYLIVWRYFNLKDIDSTCQEYFLPSHSAVSSSNQSLIIFDDSMKQAKRCIFIDNNGLVRFWPKFGNTQEFFDQKIQYVTNDICLNVIQVSENLIVAFFKSKKIILCDLNDYSYTGLTFKLFQQSDGLISGLSRRITSLFSSGDSKNINLKNACAKQSDNGESEIMFLYDSLDILKFDVLYNGYFTKQIVDVNLLNATILDNCYPERDMPIDSTIINFDYCGNIIYLLVQIDDYVDKSFIGYVLLAYNRRMQLYESYAIVKLDFRGDINLNIINEFDNNEDNLCLLVAISDANRVLIVEVLTGVIKSELDLTNNNNLDHCILGYGMKNCSVNDRSLLMIVYSWDSRMICLKQTVLDVRNTSFIDHNTSMSKSNRSIRQTDTSFNSRISGKSKSQKNTKEQHFDSSIVYDGDNMTDNSIGDLSIRFNSTNFGNESIGMDDTSFMDTSTSNKFSGFMKGYSGNYAKFYQSILYFWSNYKSKSERLIQPLIQDCELNKNNYISVYLLRIIREIIDEYPIKDPRWKKLINPDKFCFSNKTLKRNSQINGKKEALMKLVDYINVNKLDRITRVTPLLIYKYLFSQSDNSDEFDDAADETLLETGDICTIFDCIGVAGEILDFVRVFNDVFLEPTCQLFQDEMNNLCVDILSVLKKIDAVEVICQKVSLIPTFVKFCVDFNDKFKYSITKASNYQQQEKIDEVMRQFRLVSSLLARLFSQGLRASLNYRMRFVNNQQHKNFTGSLCWVTMETPVGILEYLTEIIISLLEFSSILEYFELNAWSFEVAIVTLEYFRWNIQWSRNSNKNKPVMGINNNKRTVYLTDDDDDMEYVHGNMKERYEKVRYKIIEKIVRDQYCINKALELADEFLDFYWIVSICEIKDSASAESLNHSNPQFTLDAYLKKYKNLNFSEYVLNWYQDRLSEGYFAKPGLIRVKILILLKKIQKMESQNPVLPSPQHKRHKYKHTVNTEIIIDGKIDKNKIDDLETSSVAAIDRFLDRTDVKPISWLHQLELKKYYWAGKTLEHQGFKEKKLVARRKNILSFSKLCMIAHNDPKYKRGKCWGYLELIELQDKIPKSVIHSELGYPVDKIPALSIIQIFHLYFAAMKSENDIKYAVYAMQLVNFSTHYMNVFPISKEGLEELKINLCVKLLLMDDWEDHIEAPKTITKTAQLAMESGVDVKSVLPDDLGLLKQKLENQLTTNSEIDDQKLFRMHLEMERLTSQLYDESNSLNETNGDTTMV